jgi:DNA (cytosine-5)-methyltransferase 1
MAKKSTHSLNFIDVFSGAGGLSCGLEMSGHKCLLGVDYDQHAINTFAKNHKFAQTYCGDIRKLSTKMLKELTNDQKIHAVVGGPPCQGFSTAGAGNPKDSRNQLFLEFVRVVKVTKPSFVVMENVTGLVAKKNELILKRILKQFTKLGYQMEVQVLSAHNYGVAEKRRRTIFIGTLINDKPIFPQITHEDQGLNKKKHTVTLSDIFSNLTDRKKVAHNHDIDAAALKNSIDRKRIARIPEGKGIRYERDEKAYFTKSLKLGVNWEELKENRFRQCKYQRLDNALPSPTIMTNRHSYYHPTENRYLTAREAAKIQSFPNNFIFTGPVSAQWRQIGNAVPPLLGKSIGIALGHMVDESMNTKLGQKTKKNTNKEVIKNIRGKAFVYRNKSQKNDSHP